MPDNPKNRNLTASAPVVAGGDPHTNLITAAAVAIEDRYGEQEGWDRPSRLFTLRLLSAEAAKATLYPEAVWNPQNINPADALGRLGGSLAPVPAVLPPLDAAEAPVCAVGFMFEGWVRDPAATLPPHLEQLRQASERVNHLAPDRREVRIVHTIDLKQRAFHIVRHRGEQARTKAPGDHQRAEGTVHDALARIMHAMVTGKRVLPGQPV